MLFILGEYMYTDKSIGISTHFCRARNIPNDMHVTRLGTNIYSYKDDYARKGLSDRRKNYSITT